MYRYSVDTTGYREGLQRQGISHAGFRQFAKGVVENSSVNDSTQTKHSLSPVSALAAIVPEGGRNLTQG